MGRGGIRSKRSLTTDEKTFHIVMYPWFAMGHLTSFFHLSTKLAERGHRISFLLPTKTQPKLEPFNLHKHLITFVPITVPSLNGLPPEAETTSDVPSPFHHHLLMTAMDLTQPVIEAILRDLKPHFVFFDFSHWLPALANKLGIISILYCTISPAAVGYLLNPERNRRDRILTEADLLQPPQGFPHSNIKLRVHEARGLVSMTLEQYYESISFTERLLTSFRECDAIVFKTCREIEGVYCDYVESQFNKPVILAGPVLPEPPCVALEEKWETLLGRFKPKSLVFCAFGSECVMKKDSFQELILGFEHTGLPFFAALKPPLECETIEAALPEGFEERVKGRGVVHGGWIQQQLFLKHPCVGCFVTHCGSGSLSEAMVNDCQLVLLPNFGDQFINARFMGGDLRVGVEVDKGEEDGLFTRDDVCKAVKAAMDDDSELGKEVKRNHTTWREFLLSQGLENSYINSFIEDLSCLLK